MERATLLIFKYFKMKKALLLFALIIASCGNEKSNVLVCFKAVEVSAKDVCNPGDIIYPDGIIIPVGYDVQIDSISKKSSTAYLHTIKELDGGVCGGIVYFILDSAQVFTYFSTKID